MYYANAELLSEQVLELAKGAQPPLSWFCIDAAAVDDVDFSAAESLHSICGLLKQQGIRLVFAVVSDDVRTELDRSGLTELIGENAYYATVGDVVNAYREKTESVAMGPGR